MKPIHTISAPAAIGVYSQAIRCDNLVFLSGQIPLDPKTMQLCSDDIREQITQVIKNLAAVCEAAGGCLANIVKMNVYLTDLQHFALVNAEMINYFTEPYPARAVIGVTSLPRDALIEIDGILVLPA